MRQGYAGLGSRGGLRYGQRAQYSRPRDWHSIAWLVCCNLLSAPSTARAAEGNLGVSVGGLVLGTSPRLAVSPHGSAAFLVGNSFRAAVHDMFSILPAIDPHGVGVYNHLSATAGLVWRSGNLNFGPSFAVFSMPACGITLCARLNGVAPGGTVHGSWYFAEPFGVSARLNVDWITGFGNVLPPGVVAVIVVGPVFRWGAR